MRTLRRGLIVVTILMLDGSVVGADRGGDTAAKERAEVLKVRQAVAVRELVGQAGLLTMMALSPDGKWLATCCNDSVVRVWETGSGKLAHRLAAHKGQVDSIAWSANSQWLVSGGDDQRIIVWSVSTGEMEGAHQQDCPVINVAFLPDNAYFVSTCGTHLRLWKLGEAEQIGMMETTGDGEIEKIAVTTSGAVITSDETRTTMWDTSTGQALAAKTHEPQGKQMHTRVRCILPLEGDDVLLMAQDGRFRWDTKSNEVKYLAPGTDYGILLTPDEKTLPAPGGHGVWIARVGGEEYSEIPWIEPPPGGLGKYGQVRLLSMSADGALLALGVSSSVAHGQSEEPADRLELVKTQDFLKLFEELEKQKKLTRPAAVDLSPDVVLKPAAWH